MDLNCSYVINRVTLFNKRSLSFLLIQHQGKELVDVKQGVTKNGFKFNVGKPKVLWELTKLSKTC